MWKDAILLDKGTDFSGFKNFDPRFQEPFVSEQGPSGAGLLLQWVAKLEIEGHELRYINPNNVALFFALAERAGLSAVDLLANVKDRAKADSHGSVYDRAVLYSDSVLICDFLEAIQTAVVFSFTAIEAFTNISIPNDYIYETTNSRKTELYNKDQIERWIGWQDKVSKILVAIYQTEKIENQKFWPYFLKLVEIRNNIIHQKSVNDAEYLQLLFHDEIFRICCSASEVYLFFYEHAKSSKDEKFQGNEHLWPGVIATAKGMEVKRDTIRDLDNGSREPDK